MTAVEREAPSDPSAPRPKDAGTAIAAADPLAAVEVLYRAEAARLSRSLFGYTASRAVTEDAVAEAFAQLIRRGDAVRDPRAWLWRAAFKIAAGDLQRQRRDSNELLIDIAHDLPDDRGVDLVNALQQLSEMQRKAVVLHDYAGHPAAEVARIAGSTEAAVRVHLMRGRRRLRALLD